MPLIPPPEAVFRSRPLCQPSGRSGGSGSRSRLAEKFNLMKLPLRAEQCWCCYNRLVPKADCGRRRLAKLLWTCRGQLAAVTLAIPTVRRSHEAKPASTPVPSPAAWQVVGGPVPLRRKVHPNLMPQLIEPPLPLHREAADQASFKGEVGFRADATLVRASQHEEMLSRIAILESLIAELPKQPVGIGHNRPPITQEDIGEITQAILILKAQPAIDEARAAGSTLMKFGERLGAYLLKQANVFISEAVKSAGKETGKRLVQSPVGRRRICRRHVWPNYIG
jgi:hypothetical protein